MLAKKILSVILFILILIAATNFCSSICKAYNININNKDPIKEKVEKSISKDMFLGAVVIAGKPGEIKYYKAFGQRDIGKEMKKDTMFDIASITKPLTVGTSLAILVSEEKIELDDKLKTHLPELRGRGSDKITIRQTATHTSGLDNSKQLHKNNRRENLVDKILKRDCKWTPGTHYKYSCLGFIRLSEMIANVTGIEFGEYCEKNIFNKLGMKDTEFGPVTSDKRDRCARFRNPPGIINDPNAKKIRRPVGNAGVFSTAKDLSKFATLWLQKGTYNNHRFFSESVYETFTSNQSNPGTKGIVWDRGDYWLPDDVSKVSYYHTGYNGHHLVIDPFTKSYIIILTVWNHRAVSSSYRKSKKARVDVIEAVINTLEL